MTAFYLAIVPGSVRTNKLEFIFGILIVMTVRASGLAGKGLHSSVPALFPKVDVGAAFVIFTADAKFFGIFH